MVSVSPFGNSGSRKFVADLSSFSALLIALPGLINKSKTMSSQIPFGPYLIFGTVAYLIFRNYFVFI